MGPAEWGLTSRPDVCGCAGLMGEILLSGRDQRVQRRQEEEMRQLRPCRSCSTMAAELRERRCLSGRITLSR